MATENGLDAGGLVVRWLDQTRMARTARDLLEARAVASAVMRQVNTT